MKLSAKCPKCKTTSPREKTLFPLMRWETSLHWLTMSLYRRSQSKRLQSITKRKRTQWLKDSFSRINRKYHWETSLRPSQAWALQTTVYPLARLLRRSRTLRAWITIYSNLRPIRCSSWTLAVPLSRNLSIPWLPITTRQIEPLRNTRKFSKLCQLPKTLSPWSITNQLQSSRSSSYLTTDSLLIPQLKPKTTVLTATSLVTPFYDSSNPSPKIPTLTKRTKSSCWISQINNSRSSSYPRSLAS